jgi:hypothetical protein
MKTSITLLVLFLLLVACEETVELDIDQVSERVVINARITNQTGKQYVKISKSTTFYHTGKAHRITHATVTVSDDLGRVISFVHNPVGDPGNEGIYLPAEVFVGEIGRTYTLTVNVDGNLYTATDKMLPITSIDSIQYRIDENRLANPKSNERAYELLLYAKEPRETEDFYLFEHYRNDSLVTRNPTDIYISDDLAVGENIHGLRLPVHYSKMDKARIEMLSLSKAGFTYFSDLQNLINNDGGMFGPPATNPRTNLSGSALGFFQVSAISSREVVVQ